MSSWGFVVERKRHQRATEHFSPIGRVEEAYVRKEQVCVEASDNRCRLFAYKHGLGRLIFRYHPCILGIYWTEGGAVMRADIQSSIVPLNTRSLESHECFEIALETEMT